MRDKNIESAIMSFVENKANGVANDLIKKIEVLAATIPGTSVTKETENSLDKIKKSIVITFTDPNNRNELEKRLKEII